MNLTVFLHGFTGDPSSWDPLIARLPAREKSLAVYLWGHDRHADPPPTTFEKEVDRIASMIRDVGARRVHLCGYSLGARLALGALVRHPELASGAVLIGANPGLRTEADRDARVASDESWCALVQQRGIEAFVDAWSAQPLFESQKRLPPEVLVHQRDARVRHSPAGIVAAMRGLSLAHMPNFWPALGQIQVPVRLVVGEEDRRFTAMGREMVDLMPHAALTVVKGSGHNVVLEQPDAILAALAALP